MAGKWVSNKEYIKRKMEEEASAPDITIVCDVTFDAVSYVDDFQRIFDYAVEKERQKYMDAKADEEMEIEDMIADGEISSPDEYNRKYANDFNAIEHTDSINELAAKYAANVADLPSKAVVTIMKTDYNEESIKAAITDKYGARVKDISNIKKALPKDITNDNTYKAVGDMINGDDYKTYLNLKSNMSSYSLNNIALIISQYPQAICVMSGNAWYNKYGRTNIKGEKGISILKPNFETFYTEQDIDRYIDKIKEKDINKHINRDPSYYEADRDKLYNELAKYGRASTGDGYCPTYVYDINQTRAIDQNKDNKEELLNILHLNKLLKDNLENFPDILKCVESSMRLKEGSLHIDDSVSQQEGLYNAIESYAENILRTAPESIIGIKSSEPLIGVPHKMETLMTAYLISKHIGIECDDKVNLAMVGCMNDKYSIDSMEVGRRNIFSTVFKRASSFSTQFNKDFDKMYSAITKETNKDMSENNTKQAKKSKSGIERD